MSLSILVYLWLSIGLIWYIADIFLSIKQDGYVVVKDLFIKTLLILAGPLLVVVWLVYLTTQLWYRYRVRLGTMMCYRIHLDLRGHVNKLRRYYENRIVSRWRAVVMRVKMFLNVVSVDEFLQCSEETQREIVKKSGLSRMVQREGKTEDAFEDYTLISVGKLGKFLKMRNPSTGEYHFEAVPSNAGTCREALAFRNHLDVYVPPQQLT